MADYLKATKLRPGQLVLIDNKLYRVHSVEHRTPGKGKAHMQAKLRDIVSGTMTDKRFNSDEKIERASLEYVSMEFLYENGENLVFMNTETYEQVELSDDVVGDLKGYLLANAIVKIELYDGKPVGIEPAKNVVLKVEETPPAIKGATAQAQLKPATTETGLIVNVPSFIATGDLIKVSTETGDYVSRANSYDE